MLKITQDNITLSKPCIATIGIFDGVHQGHRFLIQQIKDIAQKEQLETAVITFSKHPRQVLGKAEGMRFLNTLEEKMNLLEKCGIDNAILLDFTIELSQLSAKKFIELLYHKYHVKVLVIGYDHRFGHGRKEGFSDYQRYGREIGMEIVEASVFQLSADTPISSSSIRELLSKGKIQEANEALGYSYFLTGKVVRGFQEGQKMGFPTANIQPNDCTKVIPSDGVYAVKVRVNDKEYGGMLCIGNRPTMNNGTHTTIEVNIFDFTEDIYMQEVTLIFEAYMRDSVKYDTIAELIDQLYEDEKVARRILSSIG